MPSARSRSNRRAARRRIGAPHRIPHRRIAGGALAAILAFAFALALAALPALAARAHRATAPKPTVPAALQSLQHGGALTATLYTQYASAYTRAHEAAWSESRELAPKERGAAREAGSWERAEDGYFRPFSFSVAAWPA